MATTQYGGGWGALKIQIMTLPALGPGVVPFIPKESGGCAHGCRENPKPEESECFEPDTVKEKASSMEPASRQRDNADNAQQASEQPAQQE